MYVNVLIQAHKCTMCNTIFRLFALLFLNLYINIMVLKQFHLVLFFHHPKRAACNRMNKPTSQHFSNTSYPTLQCCRCTVYIAHTVLHRPHVERPLYAQLQLQTREKWLMSVWFCLAVAESTESSSISYRWDSAIVLPFACVVYVCVFFLRSQHFHKYAPSPILTHRTRD